MDKINNLLLWCKRHTDGYENVHLNNFTSSWKSGLAFCALIHRFKPDLINYHELNEYEELYNNTIAFQVAERNFGIPSLLDAKDMATPERLSIITYVSQFYNCLKNMEPEGGPDTNKFENVLQDEDDYGLRRDCSRASVSRLRNPKCFECHGKVFLLERYVHDHNLYHRRCFRKLQLTTLDTEHNNDIIEDNLNIYGELKPNMNKNVYKHPFKNETENDDVNDYTEEEFNNNDQYKNNAEVDDDLEGDIITNEPVDIDESDYSDSTDDSESLEMFSDEEISPRETMERVQENQVLNIAKVSSLKPIKPRLYIKKKDTQLPYSTFFELSLTKHEEQFPTVYYEPVIVNQPEIKQAPINNSTKKLIEVNFINDDLNNEPINDNDDNYEDVDGDKDDKEVLDATIIEPKIVRNSIWRKPIIGHGSFNSNTRRNSSICLPNDETFTEYLEFKRKLKRLNTEQTKIEQRARAVQQQLWEINDPDSEIFEKLLSEWLDLVEQKDKLFYEENVLYAWITDVKLQHSKRKYENDYRKASLKDSKDPEATKKQEECLKKILDTVNKRSDLIEGIHEEKIKRSQFENLRRRHSNKEETALKPESPESRKSPNSTNQNKPITKPTNQSPTSTKQINKNNSNSKPTNQNHPKEHQPDIKPNLQKKPSKLLFWKHKASPETK